jgi:hypothetical protein
LYATDISMYENCFDWSNSLSFRWEETVLCIFFVCLEKVYRQQIKIKVNLVLFALG